MAGDNDECTSIEICCVGMPIVQLNPLQAALCKLTSSPTNITSPKNSKSLFSYALNTFFDNFFLLFHTRTLREESNVKYPLNYGTINQGLRDWLNPLVWLSKFGVRAINMLGSHSWELRLTGLEYIKIHIKYI